MENRKMIRRPEVEAITGLSRSTIYAKMENGTFPKPIKLSVRSVAWVASEVTDWINDRISATRGGAE